jgi:hypothetical protein
MKTLLFSIILLCIQYDGCGNVKKPEPKAEIKTVDPLFSTGSLLKYY